MMLVRERTDYYQAHAFVWIFRVIRKLSMSNKNRKSVMLIFGYILFRNELGIFKKEKLIEIKDGKIVIAKTDKLKNLLY
jgi:hypothetical protein